MHARTHMHACMHSTHAYQEATWRFVGYEEAWECETLHSGFSTGVLRESPGNLTRGIAQVACQLSLAQATSPEAEALRSSVACPPTACLHNL